MKIAAFSVRPDEKQYFDTFANVYKVEFQKHLLSAAWLILLGKSANLRAPA